MKFILLVHHDETAFEKMSDETKKGLLTESIGPCHQLDAKGEYVHASPVHPAATATLVRVRDGRSLVTDGPFIETREQMALVIAGRKHHRGGKPRQLRCNRAGGRRGVSRTGHR